jgi:hypothetical protein
MTTQEITIGTLLRRRDTVLEVVDMADCDGGWVRVKYVLPVESDEIMEWCDTGVLLNSGWSVI